MGHDNHSERAMRGATRFTHNRGSMRTLLAVLLAIGLAACAGPGASVDATRSASETASVSAAPPSDEASPSEEATPSEAPSVEAEATITGVLSGDDIEGGCVFLAAEDGSYEVIWPDGWSIDAQTLELTDPSGAVVATGGDTITVHGRMATDMASICQIGQIFEAVAVEIPE